MCGTLSRSPAMKAGMACWSPQTARPSIASRRIAGSGSCVASVINARIPPTSCSRLSALRPFIRSTASGWLNWRSSPGIFSRTARVVWNVSGPSIWRTPAINCGDNPDDSSMSGNRSAGTPMRIIAFSSSICVGRSTSGSRWIRKCDDRGLAISASNCTSAVCCAGGAVASSRPSIGAATGPISCRRSTAAADCGPVSC